MNVRKILVIAIFVLSSVISVLSNLIRSVYTRGQGYSSHIRIKDDLKYDRVLRFSVRTPRDARILLGIEESEPVYEIVLGARDNTINFIHDAIYSNDDEPKAVVRTVNLLSQQEFRNFWMRLEDDSEENDSNILQVGIEDEDTPFLEWRDKRRFTPECISFRSEVWAEWRWGYIDETYTGALYSGDKSIVITTAQGYPETQFFPLSELASHSDDGLTLWLKIQSEYKVNIVLSPIVGLDYWLTFGIEKDFISFHRNNGGAYYVDILPVTDGLGTAEHPDVNYWIKLTRDGQIMIGKAPSRRPINRVRDLTLRSPQFVSFKGSDGHEQNHNRTITSVTWSSSDGRIKQNCTPRWKEARKRELPFGAVIGGYNDRDQIFVCRASHYGHVIPGSFILHNKLRGKCHISMGIKVIKKTTFQVLTGCKFGWVAAYLGDIPENAVPAGRNVSKEIIYAARVSYGGQSIIGKLHSNQRIAYFAFNNEVIPSTNYELLVRGEYDWVL